MPNPTVLVIDDVPLNLKLIDLVLRKDGFTVYTAPDAEQALTLLQGLRPDIILVDIQLPGMDGLELTRRIKGSARLRDIVVLALTACAVKEGETKAYQAGCDGYITKPIDTTTLGNNIRRYLGRGAGMPSPGPLPARQTPAGLPLSGPEMESVRRRFLEQGTLQSRQLLEAVDSQFDPDQARGIVHRWIGTAGMIGYPGISEAAQTVQEVLEEDIPDPVALRSSVTALVREFSEPRESRMDALPDSVVGVLAGRCIALVGFAADDAERLCTALESVGARPRMFDASEPPESSPVWDCNVVMVQARNETVGSWWLAGGAGKSWPKPLILAGAREHILAVANGVQSHACEFLIDGWQPEEALMRLGFALSRPQPAAGDAQRADAPAKPSTPNGPAEIVIADDDNVVRSLVRITLEDYGMNCRVAKTGDEALEMIRAHPPQAAVLDVNMPGMDGYLVLAAIREECLPVRVILLTARKHENDITRGFTLGADDYVVKPFNTMELVARLRRLLRPR